MKKALTIAVFFSLLACFALPAAAMHHEVKIADKPGVGKYLTDAEGMTLYMFKKDSPGISACSGGCVSNWPLYYREQVAPPAGVPADDFGTITREDGAKQTTFRGYPLYYFKGDEKAGDTSGNEMMNAWYVIDPGNFSPQ